jgi:hypothetical protein
VGVCAHRNLQVLTITKNPLNVHPNESKTAGPTSVKQIYVQEGSPCPSSTSHRLKPSDGAERMKKGRTNLNLAYPLNLIKSEEGLSINPTRKF